MSLRGFKNLGNTCFVNAILQCIINNDCFVSFLKENAVDSCVERKHGKNLCAEIFKPLCQTNLLLRITIPCMQIMSISVHSALCAP